MRLALLLAAVVMVPGVALAQKEPATTTKPPKEPFPPSVRQARRGASMLGRVSVGDAAPTFELEGSRGRPVKLASLRGSWLVLAFSDRWQPLGRMVEIEDEMRRLGAEIVGVCHEKSRTLSAAQQRDSISFLLLSDLTGQVSATYGLYNDERSETLPGFLVIDRRGVVKMVVHGPLPPPDTIARIARFAITGL